MKKLFFLATLFLLSACTSETFHSYECKDDCSGHKAGYEWAKDNDVDTQNNCLSHSQSFQEGCFVWVEQSEGTKLSTLTNTSSKKEIIVKYRNQNPVDVSISQFETINPNESTVQTAYYDSLNKYLIIKLTDK